MMRLVREYVLLRWNVLILVTMVVRSSILYIKIVSAVAGRGGLFFEEVVDKISDDYIKRKIWRDEFKFRSNFVNWN